MTPDIVRHRLQNQFLSQTGCTQPVEVVEKMAAVQAQDYAGAKWGLGLRFKNATEKVIDDAFDEGKILRTHILRPTWHFISPQDIRWMLALSAPRVHAINAFMYRQLELDRAILRQSYRVVEKALAGGRQRTRSELGATLEKAGIYAEGQRLGYIMMSAELDGVLCSGARRGKQFTYALLEERVPAFRVLERDEALAELTRRYLVTRGPATLQDFTWWSGLSMADARTALEMNKSRFQRETVDGKTYWFGDIHPSRKERRKTAHLLPNYDEYFIGYKDRGAIGRLVSPLQPEKNSVALNAHILILGGQIVGGWKRTRKKDVVLVEWNLITSLTPTGLQALHAATRRYGTFLGLGIELAT